MCWFPSGWLELPEDDPVDDPEDPDDDPEEYPPPDELDEDPESDEFGAGSYNDGGRLRRSVGMSGGGTGGCPLIRIGPLALLISVAQPPLPRVAPMLHATCRLPADQLGNATVL